MSVAISTRQDLVKEYPEWSRRIRISEYNLEQLTIIRNLTNDKLRFKVRIEEPMVQVYAETIEDLKEVAERFPQDMQSRIVEIGCPANELALNLLKQGKILRRREQAYRYKFMLKDGTYNQDTKEQLLNYLNSLGDLIKITNGNRKMLQRTYSWIWSVYFYSNDDSIATFLNLIQPGIVSNIHEIEQLPQ